VRVLLLDNWTPAARAELAKVCEVVTFAAYPGKLTGFDGLIPALNTPMPDLADMPDLRFVASGTTGLDHLPLDYCKSHNVAVLSLQGETDFLRGVHATAEHCVALMLALLRHIPQAHNDVCAGRWDREAWQGSELHGKTVGIVGFGRVGQQVSRLVQSFGADITYLTEAPCDDVDWAYTDKPRIRHEGWAYFTRMHGGVRRYDYDKTLGELLVNSDIVTLHVPLNDSTRNLIGEAQLRLMKPHALLINTSRGAVVDEAALLAALKEGRIAGAALDVLCGEPEVNPEIVSYAKEHDNLIITPHLAGNTAESRLKTQLRMCEKIRDFIGGVSNDHVNA
jgi:D-3-phosphoglycerate dehydrogenase